MLSMAQLRTLPLGDQVKTLMKNGTFKLIYQFNPLKPFYIIQLDIYVLICFSQGHAVCQSDGVTCVRHRLHCSTALHTAGSDARPGQLGCQKVWMVSCSLSIYESVFDVREILHFYLLMYVLFNSVLFVCFSVMFCILSRPAVLTAACLQRCSVGAVTLW